MERLFEGDTSRLRLTDLHLLISVITVTVQVILPANKRFQSLLRVERR